MKDITLQDNGLQESAVQDNRQIDENMKLRIDFENFDVRDERNPSDLIFNEGKISVCYTLKTDDVTKGEKPSGTPYLDRTGDFVYDGGYFNAETSTRLAIEPYEEIPFERISAKMLHLGYFLLLDKVDQGDGEKILKRAQECGIKTSIDLVSENSDRYSLVLPCLKYTDNLIVNEGEAGKLAGLPPLPENMRAICQRLKAFGVKERVIVHCPEYGVCLSECGYTVVPSYDLPEGFIRGTTGAGDAFCAGALNGIYYGLNDKELLGFASACAVAALSAVDATSGLKSREEIIRSCQGLKRKRLCL